jgi:2-keto-4-pentenoate hydratase/2-oxohepta-3-ene-1,7-dioic acid hydratase in catechol pathway
MDHIFGFTVVHNVVNRDRMQVGWEGWMWHNRYGDGASFDNAAPIGPWIVEKSDIEDAGSLVINKYINEELVETYNTKDLIRSVEQFVSYCSKFFTLEPGIFLSTGSPGGWVLSRDEEGKPLLKPGKNPDHFLKTGDAVRGEIAGTGTLQNPVQTRR